MTCMYLCILQSWDGPSDGVIGAANKLGASSLETKNATKQESSETRGGDTNRSDVSNELFS